MIYVWNCQNCGKETEVTRRIADRDNPPEEEELTCCDSPELKRGVTAGSFSIEGYSYDNGYS